MADMTYKVFGNTSKKLRDMGDATFAEVVNVAIANTALIINSAASTNGQLVAAGSIALQELYATNAGAAPAYVKLFNKAAAPTVGTDVPAMILSVPAASPDGMPGSVQLSPGVGGYRFALGLGLAITGGAADSDVSAVAAGQVKVFLNRAA